MARGINKVILIGNLGQAPEVRVFPDGGRVTNISIATTESWNDKQTGEKRELTEWHKVVFRNKLAEIAAEYLLKGSKVYIEGSLRTRKWQDKNGHDRSILEIHAINLQMLDSKPDSNPGKQPAPAGAANPAPQPTAQQQPSYEQDNWDDDWHPLG